MKNTLKTFAFAAVLMTVPMAVNAAEISQDRDLPTFTRIVIESSADIEVTVGGSQKVTVITEDDRMEDVVTEVRNGTLYVDMEGRRWRNADVDLEITVENLEGVEIDGSGDIWVSGINTDTFDIEIDGSGDVELSGTCSNLNIDVSGSGDIDSRRLECKTAEVYINGSGDVDAFASDSVRLDINGSGDVTIYGDPANVRPRIRGSGNLEIIEK